ncbi:thioredoxin family protein [Thiolapillus sp.]
MRSIIKAVLLPLLLAGTAAMASDDGAARGIHWYPGTVEAAFEQAKKNNKPVFLYWGAAWCPPCNQLKATLFKNPAFIRKTRLFVPVYLDGDTQAAQKLGEQFGVLGYPTLILFSPEGSEITRLPGGISLDLYPQMLDLALARVRPVATLLKTILNDGRKPSAGEWHMLAFYSWEQDGGKALGQRELSGVLKTLANSVPKDLPREKSRLDAQYLAALAARERLPDQAEKQDALERVLALLSDAVAHQDNFSFLVYDLEHLVPRITQDNGRQRRALLRAWDAALQALQEAPSLDPAQKLNLYSGKIRWLKVAGEEAPEALQQDIRQAVIRARGHLADGHERIAVNYAAYGVLKASGQVRLAEQLIAEEMQAGSNNHYWMLVLADLAGESGDEQAALNWYAQAWETARGGATRIQWGSYYIRQLTEQTPDDAARIMAVTRQLFTQLAKQKTPFHGRSKRALERVFKALNAWGQVSSPAELTQLKNAFMETCQPFGAQAMSRCEAILKAS